MIFCVITQLTVTNVVSCQVTKNFDKVARCVITKQSNCNEFDKQIISSAIMILRTYLQSCYVVFVLGLGTVKVVDDEKFFLHNNKNTAKRNIPFHTMSTICSVL